MWYKPMNIITTITASNTTVYVPGVSWITLFSLELLFGKMEIVQFLVQFARTAGGPVW